MPRPVPEFKAGHPFIVDKASCLAPFMDRVIEPKVAE